MPKPFSLQSPEQIAKEYGGNKQRIAQAMQMGVVDPTAGTLAGMFIDRMRSAQMQEGAQAPTVAQQVFAPPAPPMSGMAPPSMGAPPVGGMPPAPPMGAPPMGAMPPAPPMGAPPVGMADGGLAALPINDDMFDENMGDNYAGGGIVAFAQGDEVDYNKILRDQMAFYSDPQNYIRDASELYQPKREYAERANRFYEDVLSEEGQKKRRDEDKWFALAQLGATMASTPGSLLQAASAGINKALPGLQEASKERRAEVRDALKQLAADENMTNAERRTFVIEGMKGRGEAGKIADSLAQRAAARDLAVLQERGATERARIGAGATIGAANIYAGAQRDSNPLKMAADIQGKIMSEAQDAVDKVMEKELPAFTPEQRAAQDARRQQLFNMEVAKRSQTYAAANPVFAQMLGIAPGGSSVGAQVGAVPGGKIVVQNGRRVFVPGG